MSAENVSGPVSGPVGIVGLGYVGLPLALTIGERGGRALGFDVDEKKPATLAQGKSYLEHISDARIAEAWQSERLRATTDFTLVAQCSAVILCVPTPLTKAREPDLKYVESSAKNIAPYLQKGQVISLESTTWPGTSREVLVPILEAGSGLKAGEDFALVYSPEREDPGNAHFSTGTIPKVLGGLTTACSEKGKALYEGVVDNVVTVSSLETAEMTKLLENIFRAVNIAMVNELKVLAHRLTDAGMPLDIHEVIEAASTKPFGFMPFTPGPGLGGHCIPIDPFYLTWKARQVEMPTRFIELAGEINTAMPHYVVDRTMRALSDQGKGLRGADVLVLGVAYKPDVDDMRESPALKIIDLLLERGAKVGYHDPHVPALAPTRKYDHGLSSEALNAARLKKADVVVVVTNHKATDWELVSESASLVIDTRNVVPTKRGNVLAA